jgi:SAM-dependent methyltransferase
MFQIVPEAKGRTVLEVGCSDGLVCDIFALLEAARAHGIDIMESVGCGFPHERISYYVMNGANLAFPDNYFDLVFSIATLEHVREPYVCMAEMVRVIKPGGFGYLQVGPLYHSPFGHHMFPYFPDFPWIHLRKSQEEIVSYAIQRGIAAEIERNLGMKCEDYIYGMLNRAHVNGLFLDEYRLDQFKARDDIEVLKSSISYEGRELLTESVLTELRPIPVDVLVEHGFEIAFRRRK